MLNAESRKKEALNAKQIRDIKAKELDSKLSLYVSKSEMLSDNDLRD